ncbi:MAG: lauroyl acyltransferase [Zetaproteobacteria bacterium]|nr:MAG: lauroyl acyltransferase [Zetaproteobacteria bacterium]
MTAAVKLLFHLLRWLPVRLAGGLGAGLGRMAYWLDARHRRIALRNLGRIYPSRSLNWRRNTARECFAELGRTLFELPHVFQRSRDFLLSRIEIEGEQAFREAYERRRGVLVNACHHSNWELGALMFSVLGYHCAQLYRPLRQPGLDSFLKRCRERFGTELHSRYQGLRWMTRHLRQGGVVAMMIDQHVSNGVPVPFLGHAANTTTLPAIYAVKYDIPMFGVALLRQGRAFRFRLRFWSIPLPEKSGNAARDQQATMAAVNRSFQGLIDERPELWLWMHRRWRILDDAEDVA